MLDTRWIKLLRDLQMTPWRIALMLLAMAAGVSVFAGLLGSYNLLTREVHNNYMATNPAAASLQLDRIDAALLDAVRRFPRVDKAQAGAIYKTNFTAKDGTLNQLVIFVIEDFAQHHINIVTPETGAWPPLPNTILLERDSLAGKQINIGDEIKIPLRNGNIYSLSISGSVHDPAMPTPSYAAYAYASPATLAAMGINISLSELQVTFADKTLNTAGVEKATSELALWIQALGYKVSRIRVPPPGEHPHQGIIFSVLGVFLLFSAIAFALSAILTATIIDGLMAQQRKQIGIMKALGASNTQIAILYLTFVLILAALATTLGVPAGLLFAEAFSKMVLGFLNFSVQDSAFPIGIYGALITTAILLPLGMAAIPILKASKASVQSTVSHTGAKLPDNSEIKFGSWLYRLPGIDRSLIMAMRNSLRRRGRVVLIVLLLSSAGAMFISSLNLKMASQQHLANAAAERRYDIEVFLTQPENPQKVSGIIKKVSGVTSVEGWISLNVTPYRADGLVIENTHPDGGHGLLTLNVVPERSRLLSLAMDQGQWPTTIPPGQVILNHKALDAFPHAKIGDSIVLNVSGHPLHLQIAGLAHQKMAGKMAYISAATYQQLPGRDEAYKAYRVVTAQHDAKSLDKIAKKIEAALKAQHIPVSYTLTETLLRHEIDAHFTILVKALRFISVLMAATGVFALAAVMSIHITERTREIGIMRSMGASSLLILRNIIVEGGFISLISWAFAVALSLPLSILANNHIGTIVFDEAFPLAISFTAIGIWFFIAITGAVLASLYPALKAIKLSICDCFAY
jgi:putative ABC transport system permease protein